MPKLKTTPNLALPSQEGGLFFDLSITVTRHGPKDGFAGPLSDRGKQVIEKYYKESYRRKGAFDSNRRKLVSSPVHRALQTAYIFQKVTGDYYRTDYPLYQDERLSEKNVTEFKKLLPETEQKDWFLHWYNAPERVHPKVGTAKEAIHDFTEWILEQVRQHNPVAGALQVDAFSHGPVMAAFILRLEEMLGQAILAPVKEGQYRLQFDKLFVAKDSEFQYLSTLNFYYDFSRPDSIILVCQSKSIQIPLGLLEDMAHGLHP